MGTLRSCPNEPSMFLSGQWSSFARQLEDWGTPSLSCASVPGMMMIMWAPVCPAAFRWCFQVAERQAHLLWISLENLFSCRKCKIVFFIALLAYKAILTNKCHLDLNDGNVSLRLVVKQRALLALCSSGQGHRNQ